MSRSSTVLSPTSMSSSRRRLHVTLFAVLVGSLVLVVGRNAWAVGPRVLPEGKLPDDSRLGRLTDLNSYFPFDPPTSEAAWRKRADQVRRQLLVSQGLWPMPTRTPANPTIHGLIDQGDYTIEKVYFESYPAHFVTGNLYRPKQAEGVEKADGRRPGVLCPHGHWQDGRFYDNGREKVRKEIVAGAERFEDGGRSPLQSRCVQLARMGCVVFHYDMVGYADSQQIAHRPGVRAAMNTAENWGFFSPQAELRLQNIMGLQTYNSIRALDFLCDLPDVDTERIAVTGASGGGTQTFILCAIDPRPKVAFPAVMVSTAMQGGCTCENACHLRVGTGNMELAALFAPKPLGMTGADDWTKEIATKGFPELKRLYKTLGAGDLVMARPLLQFGHNYNYVSRAVMYSWLNEHLDLGLEEPIVEEGYPRLARDQLTVWDDEHPRPLSGDGHERTLVRWMTDDAERQIAALAPTDAESLGPFREVVGGAFDVLVHRTMPGPGAVTFEEVDDTDRGDFVEYAGIVRYKQAGEALPIVSLRPKAWNQRITIWLDGAGKAGLFDSGGEPLPAIKRLLASGTSVIGADLLYQGEFLEPGEAAPERQRMIAQSREDLAGYAGYTYGYNSSLFAKRVHDILTLVSGAKHHPARPERIDLVGVNGAGVWVAAARAQAGDAVDRAAIDTGGFRFASLTELDDVNFWPGAVKYGDVPALLALSAPSPLWVAGESSDSLSLLTAAFRAAGAAEACEIFRGEADGAADAAADWLLK